MKVHELAAGFKMAFFMHFVRKCFGCLPDSTRISIAKSKNNVWGPSSAFILVAQERNKRHCK
jgi:hypothetical protein